MVEARFGLVEARFGLVEARFGLVERRFGIQDRIVGSVQVFGRGIWAYCGEAPRSGLGWELVTLVEQSAACLP